MRAGQAFTVTCGHCGDVVTRIYDGRVYRYCGRRCANFARSYSRRPLAERFWSKVRVAGPDDCWMWTGATTPAGYGKISTGGREGGLLLATRLSLMLHHSLGAWPTGVNACHRCDTPACVNPAHLFMGTQADNMADSAAKGRMACGSRRPMAKLSEADIPVIRRRISEGAPRQCIADSFGVSRSAIRQVVIGLTWRHVPVEAA
jgi:hypothetical protein